MDAGRLLVQPLGLDLEDDETLTLKVEPVSWFEIADLGEYEFRVNMAGDLVMSLAVLRFQLTAKKARVMEKFRQQSFTIPF